MEITNIYHTKTHFSKLIDHVIEGNEVIIGKAGKPVAKLVPYTKKKAARIPGYWKGKIKIEADFDEELPEINTLFYGKK